MPSRRRQALPHWRATLVSLAMIGLVYAWFWIVAAHRIDEPPSYAAFASVFKTGCGDFEHFYHAALAMRTGGDPYAAGVRGYIYPPLIALLYMPLTLLSVQTAAAIALVLNMVLALACTWLAAHEFARRFSVDTSFHALAPVLALTALVSATRLRGELQMWQTNLIMLVAVLLALRFLDARPWLAGLLLGLAVNVKYLPLVYLPYLLLRRRFVAAAWLVIGFVGFALLPALRSGWRANLEHWAVAANGIASLLGIAAPAVRSANVDPISIGHSISITSGLARLMGPDAAPLQAVLAAAVIAIAALLGLAALYARRGKPFLAWPPAPAQVTQPWLGMVGLEWAAVLTLTLALSPQTNPRHTSLLLIAFAPLAVLLCRPLPDVPRRAAFTALAILFLGLALPPGTTAFAAMKSAWSLAGGPGWCMLAMLPFFFVAGFRHLDAAAFTMRRSASPPGHSPIGLSRPR